MFAIVDEALAADHAGGVDEQDVREAPESASEAPNTQFTPSRGKTFGLECQSLQRQGKDDVSCHRRGSD